MSYKNNKNYAGKKEIIFDFSADAITSNGASIIAKSIEKNNNIVRDFSNVLVDNRDKNKIKHSLFKLILQRVVMMIQGHPDCNDANYVKDDKVTQLVVNGEIASQPTCSRLENSVSIKDIWNLSLQMVDKYASSIDKDRKSIIIDVDGTNDPAYGNQQLVMFNGYYGERIYHLLLFHDGETGQLILPVLRPGSCHSNKWFVGILRRMVERIRAVHPDIEIIIRGDCGFSAAAFYKLANNMHLKFCIGISRNERLKQHSSLLEQKMKEKYLNNKQKEVEFCGPFKYQADTWDEEQTCYAKVESTGHRLNIRYICSNLDAETAKELYYGFYVKRGDASENRIKEFKNMCYADRLSCKKFVANYFRLFLSALCYEFYYQIKELIKQTNHDEPKRWQIDNIRLYLIKAGAMVREKVRSIRIMFSQSYICKSLFMEIMHLCH
jgi:hypothetical protein